MRVLVGGKLAREWEMLTLLQNILELLPGDDRQAIGDMGNWAGSVVVVIDEDFVVGHGFDGLRCRLDFLFGCLARGVRHLCDVSVFRSVLEDKDAC